MDAGTGPSVDRQLLSIDGRLSQAQCIRMITSFKSEQIIYPD